MPTGPEGEKRPADAIGLAVRIARIATGEESESAPVPAKRSAGKAGGTARSRKLTPQQRSEIARVAAEARWKKSDD
ncbi:hypothetical protein GCM10011321_31940 [Youhaiella tibetensis]|uniref:RNA-binding protein n=1 Tax=Paradevosia tibetensis TaxID=1447062 RepID=A0A5B9DJJ9_9HYPH|nr:RNA-binding protein [Youhaiella tibetensis]GGF38602.1 hypothetical protein GCM10011321_31940 [Youhaiella tibetensis]